MTKEEFIQEAALRMLTEARGEVSYKDIADAARLFADEIYGHEEPSGLLRPSATVSDQDIIACFPADERISVVINEIDRMDEREKARKNAGLPPGTLWRYSKSGNAKIVLNGCQRENIETVKQLLDFGRIRFLGITNIGNQSIKALDKALLNLYNIKIW